MAWRGRHHAWRKLDTDLVSGYFLLQMRINTIINRHIFKELMTPFSISLLFLTFIFLMTRIPEITNMVVNYHTGISVVLCLISYSLPRFMEFTIPMSVMVSVLLTFMRMSGDNEIIALKGGGMTIYRLLPPVVLFCLMGFLFTMGVTVCGVPWGKLALKRTTIELARSNLNLSLEERTFNSSIKGVMIYVSSMEMQTKELKDVFIEDSRVKDRITTTVAPRGILVSDPDRMIYALRLFNGKVNQVNLETRMVNTVDFDLYDMNFDLADRMRQGGVIKKDLDEMNLRELFAFIRHGSSDKTKISKALMGLHEKFSIPTACLALGILSLALGLQSASNRRTSGLGLGLFFFLLYYLLLAAGWSAGETGRFSPKWGMWLPNILMGGMGIFLLVRIAQERPVRMPLVLRRALNALTSRFRKEG